MDTTKNEDRDDRICSAETPCRVVGCPDCDDTFDREAREAEAGALIERSRSLSWKASQEAEFATAEIDGKGINWTKPTLRQFARLLRIRGLHCSFGDSGGGVQTLYAASTEPGDEQSLDSVFHVVLGPFNLSEVDDEPVDWSEEVVACTHEAGARYDNEDFSDVRSLEQAIVTVLDLLKPEAVTAVAHRVPKKGDRVRFWTTIGGDPSRGDGRRVQRIGTVLKREGSLIFLGNHKVTSTRSMDILPELPEVIADEPCLVCGRPAITGLPFCGNECETSAQGKDITARICAQQDTDAHCATCTCNVKPAPLHVGARVRLKRQVDRFPHCIIYAGAEGTVAAHAPGKTTIVTLDLYVEELHEWHNALVWDFYNLDCLADDLEVITK